MIKKGGPSPFENEWRLRLFGVGCDAEEAERWLEAFCIFEHLVRISLPDVELRLRLARAALHADQPSIAEEQSFEIDYMLNLHPCLRSMFGSEAAALRKSLEMHDWKRWGNETPPVT